LCFVFIWTD